MTIKTKITRDTGGGDEESRIEVFVQQMLITRVFAATYTGRNYVQSLKDYRDVLKIDEGEKDLIKDLEIVKNRINNFFKGALWAAITGAEDMESHALSGCCVWVKLENVAFGSYWFMVQHVSFSDLGELVLRLKVIRKYETEVKSAPNVFDSSMNWDELKTNLRVNTQEITASLIRGFQEILTWNNLKESSRFTFLLLMTVATALLSVLQYVGDYSIRFFREFSNLIKVMTPIFLAIIDMLSKIVGGFYLLLVILWRGPGGGPMPQFPSLQAPPTRQFKPVYQRRTPHVYHEPY